MSYETVGDPVSTGPIQSAHYRNPVGSLILAVATVVLVPIGLAGGILFRVVEYFGWVGDLALTVFLVFILYLVWSFFLFLSVDIRPGRVVLRAPLRKFVVDAVDVERVELDPPVRSLTMKTPAWGRTSKLVIHRRKHNPIDASVMPDGLKMRIANALDPANHPLPKKP